MRASFPEKVKNLASLGGIQAANAVLPLIIFPYALSVIGADEFAKIVLAESIAVLLGIVVFYSFEIEGVAKVVGLDVQRDAKQISQIFSGILYARLCLFVCVIPVGLGSAWMINPELVWPVLCWLMVPMAYALQANWLCLGLERNAVIAVAAWVTRLLALSILLIGLNKSNAIIVPLVIASMVLLAAMASLVYVASQLNVRLVKVPIKDVRDALVGGRHVFLANLTVGLYRDVNVLILGILGVGGSMVAAYALAEKFVKMVQATIRPFNQLFFPNIISLATQAGRPSGILLRNLLRYVWPQLWVLLSLLLLLAAAELVARQVLGWELGVADDVRVLFLVMSASAFAGVANFMLGMAGLTGLRETGYLLKVTAWIGLANVLIVFVLVYFSGGMGAAVGFVVSEVMLLVLIVYRYLRD